MREIWLALLVVSLAGCTASASKQDIQCPAPQSGQVAGTVKENAAQIAQAGQQLHYGNSNAITEVAAAFRQRHPEARSGAVINYLLTAYCPLLNSDDALDQNARRHAMKEFAKQAEAVILQRR